MQRRSLVGMVLVLFTVFSLGLWTGQHLPAAQAKGEAYAKLDIFAKVLNYVQTNYVDEVNEQDLIYGAIKGMLDTLDPHTVFLPPDVYREMKIDTTGEFFRPRYRDRAAEAAFRRGRGHGRGSGGAGRLAKGRCHAGHRRPRHARFALKRRG